MGNGSEPPPDCTGSACGYGIAGGQAGCQSGDGSCWSARMIDAMQSDFHPAELQNATKQIQTILNSISPPREDLKLSFVHTRMGSILAWVKHGTYTTDAITSANTDAEIAEALGLIQGAEQTAEAS